MWRLFTFLCVMRILHSITIKKASSRRSLMSLCYKTISSCCSCAYVEILSTWEVWRALKRLELHSAAPRATLTPLSCSPNFPRAQYLDIRTLTHELIVNWQITESCTISTIILRADKFLKCDWLRPVVFKPNLKYLHVKITPVT